MMFRLLLLALLALIIGCGKSDQNESNKGKGTSSVSSDNNSKTSEDKDKQTKSDSSKDVGMKAFDVIHSAFMLANQGKYDEAKQYLPAKTIKIMEKSTVALIGWKGVWDAVTKNCTIEKIEFLKEEVQEEEIKVYFKICYKNKSTEEMQSFVSFDNNDFKLTFESKKYWEKMDRQIRQLTGEDVEETPSALKIEFTDEEIKKIQSIPKLGRYRTQVQQIFPSPHQQKLFFQSQIDLYEMQNQMVNQQKSAKKNSYPCLYTKALVSNNRKFTVLAYSLNHGNIVPVVFLENYGGYNDGYTDVYTRDNFVKVYEIQSACLKRIGIHSTLENGICDAKESSRNKFSNPLDAVKLQEWKCYNPLPTDNDLNGVWGNSSKDVFVVGDKGTVLHYNGVWEQQDSGVWDDLHSVWSSENNNAFAVGKNGTMLHYDGNSWSQMPRVVWSDLHAVWGSSKYDVYAVGKEGIILHYDGKVWSLMSKAIPNDLYDIWGSAKDNIIAVGKEGVILRFDGNSWELDHSTNIDLYGLCGSSANDIYAVGARQSFRYDGKSWSEVKDGPSGYRKIWGKDKNNIFSVTGNGYIAHYDGKSWKNIPSNCRNELRDIWGNVSDFFIVGVAGTILHYDYNTLTNMGQHIAGLDERSFHYMWGTTDSDIFLVGGYNGIIHYDGKEWKKMEGKWSQSFKAVWGTDSNHVYMVGGSSIWRYNGKVWLQLKIQGYGGYPTGVWGSSSKDVYIIESGGTILHFDGTQWAATRATPLYGIWGSSSSDVFTVGNGVFHYDGKSWSEMAVETNPSNLRAVWGTSSSDVFAVGEGIFHYDGKSWRRVFYVRDEHFYTVWGTSSNNVFVGGDKGIILRYDGKNWIEMITHTNKSVFKIWGLPNGKMFAIGDCAVSETRQIGLMLAY